MVGSLPGSISALQVYSYGLYSYGLYSCGIVALGRYLALQHLTALSIVSSRVHGELPLSLGHIPSLKMIWLDHNPALGGDVPTTFAQLDLSVLELHFSNFSGVLPALDYLGIADCTLYNDRWSRATAAPGNNKFACPLPHGAESCGAMCV